MRVGDDATRGACGDHRDLRALGEAGDLGPGNGPERAAAGHDDRTLGSGECGHERSDLGGRCGRTRDRRRESGRDDLQGRGIGVHRVGVDVEVHRAGAATACTVQRLRDVAGYPAGLRAARRPLGRGRGDGALIDIHDRPPALLRQAGPAREQHHRNAPRAGIDQTDQAIRETRPRSHGGDTGVPGGERPAFGGEGCRAFVACVDHVDVLVDARVEEREDVAAGERENGGDSALAQRSRNQRAAVGARVVARVVELLGGDIRHEFGVYRPVSPAGTGGGGSAVTPQLRR